jgi:hypothetical protein
MEEDPFVTICHWNVDDGRESTPQQVTGFKPKNSKTLRKKKLNEKKARKLNRRK